MLLFWRLFQYVLLTPLLDIGRDLWQVIRTAAISPWYHCGVCRTHLRRLFLQRHRFYHCVVCGRLWHTEALHALYTAESGRIVGWCGKCHEVGERDVINAAD